MPDREKVIDGVQFCFSESHGCIHCNGCPYEKDRVLGKACPLGKDVLALLKEQQQQIWELQDQVEYLTDKLKEQEAETELCDRCGRRRLKSCREVK